MTISGTGSGPSALSSGLAGMKAAQEKLDSSAVSLANIGGSFGAEASEASGGPVDTVQLSDAAVSLLQAKNANAASVAVVKAADEMMKSVVSLLA